MSEKVRYWLSQRWVIPVIEAVLIGAVVCIALFGAHGDMGTSIPPNYTPMGNEVGSCGSAGPAVYQREYGIDGDARLIIFGVMGHKPAIYIHLGPGEHGGVVAIYLVLPGKPVQHFPDMNGLRAVVPSPCELLKFFTPRQPV